MRELQLSLLRFKKTKFTSSFWTESTLPECREVLRSVTPAVRRRRNYNFAVIAITLRICYNVLKEGENEQLRVTRISRTSPRALIFDAFGLVVLTSRTGVEPNCLTAITFRVFRRAFTCKVNTLLRKIPPKSIKN